MRVCSSLVKAFSVRAHGLMWQIVEVEGEKPALALAAALQLPASAMRVMGWAQVGWFPGHGRRFCPSAPALILPRLHPALTPPRLHPCPGFSTQGM